LIADRRFLYTYGSQVKGTKLEASK